MKILFIGNIFCLSICSLWAVDKQKSACASGDFVEGSKNYLCKKCLALVQMKKIPSYNKCPKSGFHEWDDLGYCGSDAYQCSKCTTLVKSKKTPRYAGCPSGGFHEWNKL